MATGTRIVVGCKLPQGLYIDAPTQRIEDGNKNLIETGERDLDRRVLLRGTNSTSITGDDGVVRHANGGYGVTVLEGDQAETFRDWMKRMADFPPVKRGFIFEVATEADAKKEGVSRAKLKNGMEGLDPDKPGPGVTKADRT
ncbi:MAG: hypothetical protein K2X46_06200 [Roseomonas sp.]|nr:hypothetical protein [Roseomonas sp.]